MTNVGNNLTYSASFAREFNSDREVKFRQFGAVCFFLASMFSCFYFKKLKNSYVAITV